VKLQARRSAGEAEHIHIGSQIEHIVDALSKRDPNYADALRHGSMSGAICGPATKFLFDWNPESVRPPIFPARVESLASVAGAAER
jgi:hypothetical protein